MFRGTQSSVPRAASILVDGNFTRVIFDTGLPNQVVGIIGRSHGKEDKSYREEDISAFGGIQTLNTFMENLGGEVGQSRLCEGRGEHAEETNTLCTVSPVIFEVAAQQLEHGSFVDQDYHGQSPLLFGDMAAYYSRNHLSDLRRDIIRESLADVAIGIAIQ